MDKELDLHKPDLNRAFLREFTIHEPAIRAYVRRLVPTRSDADDVLQEVAIVLWEKFEEFEVDGNFAAWAYGIARFKVLSWLRDKRRDRLTLSNEVIEIISQQSPDQEKQLQRQRDALETCLQKIKTQDRQLLTAAYRPDQNIQEIAAASGRSMTGFYQWLYRTRQKLLQCVKRKMATEQMK